MILTNLVQGSPAWAQWRLEGLGGTDARTILDAHERRPGALHDLKALLGEKLAPPPPDGRYPEHWRARGPTEAVVELIRRVGWKLYPACCQHDEAPWLRATLQGLTWAGDAIALCSKNLVRDHELVLAGELPDGAMPQIQHCLLASGAILCWYVSWSDAKRFAEGERWAVLEVIEDAEYQARLLDVETQFWERLCLARRGLAATA